MLVVFLMFLAILLLLLKIAVVAEYGEDGFSGYLKILFFKLKLPPEKKKKEKKDTKTDGAPKEKRNFGNLESLKGIVSPVLKTLGKLLRMISINRLVLDVKIATGDAYSTALVYGGAWAGVGMIFPALDNIKIKKKSISINADFENTESTAYMYADVSIRVWQILILGIYLILQYIRKQKGFEKNGGTRT